MANVNDLAKQFYEVYVSAGGTLNDLMVIFYEAGLAAGTAANVAITGGAINGTTVGAITPAAVNSTTLQCDSFRIDAAPTIAVIADSTHKIAINLNGVTYYILLSSV